jgi:hypothetical protein
LAYVGGEIAEKLEPECKMIYVMMAIKWPKHVAKKNKTVYIYSIYAVIFPLIWWMYL